LPPDTGKPVPSPSPLSNPRREYAGGGYFSTRLPPDPRRRQLWKVLCSHLQAEIPISSAVLELGGGYCDFINHIRAAEKHVVDLSPDIAGFAAGDVVTHVQPCWELDQFPGERFDIVFASNLFEHLTREELLATLSGIRRILRPGGKLLIVQPNFRYAYKHYFDDYTHIAIFTDVSLADLLKTCGFYVDKVVPRYLPFSLGGRAPKWAWLLRVYLNLPYRPMAGQMYIACSKPGSSSPR
jgi:SAM-dependent methyltransferase